MPARIPSDEEIRAAVVELKLSDGGIPIPPSGPIPSRVRAKVAKILHERQKAEEAPQEAAPPPALLSRYTHHVPGGTLQVDVTFIPDPKGSDNGRT